MSFVSLECIIYTAILLIVQTTYSICITTLYPLDGTPPYDGFPEETIHQNHLALIIIYDIAAFVGLIFVAVCLLFNIFFRNKKSVTGYYIC